MKALFHNENVCRFFLDNKSSGKIVIIFLMESLFIKEKGANSYKMRTIKFSFL